MWTSRTALTILFLMSLAGCAMAQTPPPAADEPPATQPSLVDRTLDQLHALGQGLRDFSADVTLRETDALVGDSVTRGGKVWYLAPGEGDALIRITFETRQVADDQPKPEKLEYALKEGWLIERDYRRRTEVNRQVRGPEEKMNLLKLGEGPFPLPIGQERAEVLRLFEVTHVPPAGGDPHGETIHLRLVPLPDTRFARKFDAIDVWVDRQSQMPSRIETTDAGGNTVRTTDLSDIRMNGGLNESDLSLPAIDQSQWTRHDEPFVE